METTFFLQNQYYNMTVILSLSIIILRLIDTAFKIFISMNLSPSRSPSHPHSQAAHQIKPRVAFTYQINNPSHINNLTQASPVQGCLNNKMQQISAQKTVGNIINGNNAGKNLCTPQKLFEKDKQNANISQNKRNEWKNVTNIESQGNQHSQFNYKITNEKGQQASEVSNFTLNNLKNKQIQLKMALPPLSPKNLGKKAGHQRTKTGNISSQNTINNLTSRSKCPSFLAHKQKNQEFIDQSSNEILNKTAINFGQNKRLSMGENGRFCKCGQFATHKYDIKQICCYKCGITKMFEGHELFPLQIQNKTITINSPTTKIQERPQIKQVQPEVEKNPAKFQILSKLVQNQEVSISGQKVLKQIEQEKKSLTKFYRESIETQDENIKNFYKERKLELKNHYEKVKLALKASIEQDLLQLELMQKEQINEWRKSIQLMEDDLKKLQKIESKIRESVTIQKKLNKQLFQEYQEVAIKGKYENKPWRVSKLQGQADTMNLSGISNLTSPNISGLNITLLLKNFNSNGQVYKPQIYRMVGCVIKSQLSSPRPSDLGSQIIQRDCQSPNQVSYIEENNVELQKQTINRITTPKNYNKNVLFSFEGQKC